MSLKSDCQPGQHDGAAGNSRRNFPVIRDSLPAAHFPASCALTLSPVFAEQAKSSESYWKLMATVTEIVWFAPTFTGRGSPAAAPAAVFPSRGLAVKAATPMGARAQFERGLVGDPQAPKFIVVTEVTVPCCCAAMLPDS